MMTTNNSPQLTRALVNKRNIITKTTISSVKIIDCKGLCLYENIWFTNFMTDSSHTSDALFKLIIDKSVEATFVIGIDGLVLYANEAAIRLFVPQGSDYTGMIFDLPTVHPESKKQKSVTMGHIRSEAIAKLAHSNKIQELHIILPNKQMRFVEARANQIFWENKTAFLAIFHDITDIKRVAQLTAEISEKSRLESLKDEFIGIVSHEMRTPLTIIKGAISNLKDGIVGPVSEKQIKILETTNRNVDRLARIINDLLDLSRLESGKAKINKRKIDVAPLIEEVVQNFQHSASEKNITITCEIPPNISAIFADSDMIVQVLTNLINNSLRYAKKQISIQCIQENFIPKIANRAMTGENDMVRLGVIDDGDGIAKEHLGSLFNKFEQINRPSGGSGYKGTGLGLAICKQIISLHHGRIWADSTPGKGSSFYFLLPQYHENDDILVSMESVLNQAEKNKASLAILAVAISNLTEIIERCSEKDIAWMFSDLSKEIRNKALRKPDFLHFKRDSREFIIVLPDTDRDLSQKIVNRIHLLTKDCFCPSANGKMYVGLKIGMAVFPDDGNDAKKLLELTMKERH